MQNTLALLSPPLARYGRHRPGHVPTSWRRLAHVRAYTLRYGMRAAKLTAVGDCIRAIRREGGPRLP